jgi:hypothetical protein
LPLSRLPRDAAGMTAPAIDLVAAFALGTKYVHFVAAEATENPNGEPPDEEAAMLAWLDRVASGDLNICGDRGELLAALQAEGADQDMIQATMADHVKTAEQFADVAERLAAWLRTRPVKV